MSIDPIEQWRRADSGAGKAAAGNRLVEEVERLRCVIRRLADYADSCIFDELGEVCDGCRCGKADLL